MRLVSSLILALGALGVATAADEADRVTSLPGWDGELPGKVYAGYVDSSRAGQAAGTQQLFYWLFVAEDADAQEHLTLWLNGGPGCSSLEGALTENGPLHLVNSTLLTPNPYAWTMRSSMLYMEQPVGVGFSYDLAGYKYINDTATAEGTYLGLLNFFEKFPELASLDFHITGESYAGVYIPSIANRIVTGNKDPKATLGLSPWLYINLDGIMVGNGCTGSESGACGPNGYRYRTAYLQGRAMTDPFLTKRIEDACGDKWGRGERSQECVSLLREQSIGVGEVNIYNTLVGCDLSLVDDDGDDDLWIDDDAKPHGGGRRLRQTMDHLALNHLGQERPAGAGPIPCVEGADSKAYFNRQDVQEALHVAASQKHFGTWTSCSSIVTPETYTTTWTDLPTQVYPRLVERINVLIFNGDADACVPWTQDVEWTGRMGYQTIDPWRPWLSSGLVAGYYVGYDAPGNGTFAFATVKEAGHMVPTYQPERALVLFGSFIDGKAPPA